jgi:putative tricarboxylic transport membrane protein
MIKETTMPNSVVNFTSDRYFSAVAALLAAIFFVVIGGKADPASAGNLSASTYPRTILSTIIIISIYLAFKPTNEHANKTKISLPGIVSIILMAVYISLLELIGFFILTPILLALLPLLAGFRSYRWILISVVCVTLTIYGVFVLVLNIPLPPGLFGD